MRIPHTLVITFPGQPLPEYLIVSEAQAQASSNGTLLREEVSSWMNGWPVLQVTMRERTERHTTIAPRHRAESPGGVVDTA